MSYYQLPLAGEEFGLNEMPYWAHNALVAGLAALLGVWWCGSCGRATWQLSVPRLSAATPWCCGLCRTGGRRQRCSGCGLESRRVATDCAAASSGAGGSGRRRGSRALLAALRLPHVRRWRPRGWTSGVWGG